MLGHICCAVAHIVLLYPHPPPQRQKSCALSQGEACVCENVSVGWREPCVQVVLSLSILSVACTTTQPTQVCDCTRERHSGQHIKVSRQLRGMSQGGGASSATSQSHSTPRTNVQRLHKCPPVSFRTNFSTLNSIFPRSSSPTTSLLIDRLLSLAIINIHSLRDSLLKTMADCGISWRLPLALLVLMVTTVNAAGALLFHRDCTAVRQPVLPGSVQHAPQNTLA